MGKLVGFARLALSGHNTGNVQVLETIDLGEYACGIGRLACALDFVFDLTKAQTGLSIPQTFAPKMNLHGQTNCQYLDRTSGNDDVLGGIALGEIASGTGWSSRVLQLHTGKTLGEVRGGGS